MVGTKGCRSKKVPLSQEPWGQSPFMGQKDEEGLSEIEEEGEKGEETWRKGGSAGPHAAEMSGSVREWEQGSRSVG